MSAIRGPYYPDGSASAPSVRFLAELTGLYRRAAGQLGFSVLGVDVGNFAASGLTLVGALNAQNVYLPDGSGLVFGAGVSTYLQGNNAAGYIRSVVGGVVKLEANSTGVSIGNASTIKAVRTATASLDWPSIAAGGAATLTIVVTGAQVGDQVDWCIADGSAPYDALLIRAYVASTNNVVLRAVNLTAAPVDVPAQLYRATVTSF